MTFLFPALILGGVLAFGLIRLRQGAVPTLLSMALLLFALGYGMPPIFFALAESAEIETSTHIDATLFSLEFYRILAPTAADLNSSSLNAFVAVACIVAGYIFSSRFLPRFEGTVPSVIGQKPLLLFGLVFLIVSALSFYLYARQFDGLLEMLRLGRFIRGDVVQVQGGFYQVLALLALPAAIFLAAAGFKASGYLKWVLMLLATVGWAILMMRTYHAAGRMVLFTTVAVMPLAFILHRGLADRWARLIGVLVVAAAGIILMIPQEFFSNPAMGITSVVDALVNRLMESTMFVLNEFAFPYVVSTRTASIVPDVIEYRYFVDFPLTVLYLLPSLSGPDTWPPLTAHLHLEAQAEFANDAIQLMPIDFVSFGLYNLGLLGVVSASLIFGALTRMIEHWLADTSDPLTA